jgi:1,4-dihydroxy-2-naphthoate octaprenyltransferase
MNITAITQSMRLPFLVLTFVSVFLGACIVIASQRGVNLLFLFLALVGGLLAHISVNTLNEHVDFKSGLDYLTKKTPFSGGSGTLPQHPEAANAVFKTGVVSLTLTTLIGCFLFGNTVYSFCRLDYLGFF